MDAPNSQSEYFQSISKFILGVMSPIIGFSILRVLFSLMNPTVFIGLGILGLMIAYFRFEHGNHIFPASRPTAAAAPVFESQRPNREILKPKRKRTTKNTLKIEKSANNNNVLVASPASIYDDDFLLREVQPLPEFPSCSDSLHHEDFILTPSVRSAENENNNDNEASEQWETALMTLDGSGFDNEQFDQAQRELAAFVDRLSILDPPQPEPTEEVDGGGDSEEFQLAREDNRDELSVLYSSSAAGITGAENDANSDEQAEKIIESSPVTPSNDSALSSSSSFFKAFTKLEHFFAFDIGRKSSSGTGRNPA